MFVWDVLGVFFFCSSLQSRRPEANIWGMVVEGMKNDVRKLLPPQCVTVACCCCCCRSREEKDSRADNLLQSRTLNGCGVTCVFLTFSDAPKNVWSKPDPTAAQRQQHKMELSQRIRHMPMMQESDGNVTTIRESGGATTTRPPLPLPQL